jgi:hypothetical protein
VRAGIAVLEPHDALVRGLLPPGGFVILSSVLPREGGKPRWEARYFRNARVSAGEDGSYLVEGAGGEVIVSPSASPSPSIISFSRHQSLRIEGPRGPGYALVFLPGETMAESFSSLLAKVLETEASMDADNASSAALLAAETLRALIR